jgi:hypothetical protein
MTNVATLAEIIQREVNPFDPVTLKTGNFWTDDKKRSIPTVQSIHQQGIEQIQTTLKTVSSDRYTRTVLLTGDSGCGKSYLLGRLKEQLNSQAFFAYIDPCPSSDCIWRHTLRYTVDSLMHVPEGKQESQLLLWLKQLANLRDRSLMQKLLGAKGMFVLNFRSTYPTGIFQAKDFFTVLYQLTQPNLYFLACDWLRGENLDKEDLKLLGVSSVIDSEESARGIIGNLGIISEANKPIVICFDQVETYRAVDGSFDISSVFNINTSFHNSNLRNFLIIISITLNQFNNHKKNLLQSDLARIEQEILLKDINLEQVEALWSSRLAFLHSQANPKPISAIEPLKKQEIEQKYPGGRANLRDSLTLASKLFLDYKTGKQQIKIEPEKNPSIKAQIKIETKTKSEAELTASFKLLWQDEFTKTQTKITRIRQFSSQQLSEMLQQGMSALLIKEISSQFLSGKYSSYSFSYRSLEKGQKNAILWNEEPSLQSFSYAMKACQKAIQENPNYNLILIRSEPLGNSRNRGYQIYQKIFQNSSHRHLKSELNSVHYLRTYQKLANEAIAGDLVLGSEVINLEQLQELVRETRILQSCSLLQKLEVLPQEKISPKFRLKLNQETAIVFHTVQVQKIIGKQQLINQTISRFPQLQEIQIEEIIEQLSQNNKIKIMNPQAAAAEQLICLVN